MQHPHREFGFVLVDQDADLDFAGADCLDIDRAFGEGLEHRRGDPGVAFHSDADDTDLGDMRVRDDPEEADLALLGLEHRQAARQIGARHGKRDVGLAFVLGDVLDDHVDVDAGGRQWPEDVCDRARPIGYPGQRDLGFVLVVRDAGDQLAFHIVSFHFCVADDHRSGNAVGRGCVVVDERGQHLNAHAFLHRQPDRPRLKHFGSDAGELEHFFVSDGLELARLGDDPWVGGIDPVDIGIDIAAIGLDGGGDGDGGSVRAATTQRGQAAIVGQALKAGDDRDLATGHRGDQRLGGNVVDPRFGVRADGFDGKLPAEPRARLAAQRLKGEREQARSHLFSAGDDHVVFGGIEQRIGLAREIDQPVGLAGHRADDHRNLVPGGLLALDDPRNAADALGPGHAGAAELHHDPGQAGCSCATKCRRGPLARRRASC